MASTYLERTIEAGSNGKTFTYSVWFKLSNLAGNHTIIGLSSDNNNTKYVEACVKSNHRMDIQLRNGTSGDNGTYLRRRTNRLFRDTNAWYHFVLRVDSTQASASDRLRVYFNGVEETSWEDSTGTMPQDYVTDLNNSGADHRLGRGGGTSSFYMDGILSHFHLADGQSYGPDTFGETDSTTGEWKIKANPGISASDYGTNGFFILKDDNTGTDHSGNSHNFSTAGTITKTEDSPSNIFATWNYLWAQSNGNVGDVTFSNGNTTTTTSSHYRTTPASLGMFGSGKYYWEIKRIEDDGNDLHAGVMSEDATPANTATWIGNAANGWVLAGDGGNPYNGGTGGSAISNASFPNSGDIHMCAYDASTGKLYFGANGTWGGTADPSTGANPHYTLDTSKVYFPCVSTGSDCSANFGNGYFGTTAVGSAGTNASNIGIFEYDVPTGFTALSTKGINSF